MKRIDPIKKAAVLLAIGEWEKLPLETRGTFEGVCRKHGILQETVRYWQNKKAGKTGGNSVAERAEFIEELKKKAYQIKANPMYMKMYGDAKRFLEVEKMEVKVELNADDYAKIRFEAKRRLEEFHSKQRRVRDERTGRAVFSDGARSDTEPDVEQDNKVGAIPVLA